MVPKTAMKQARSKRSASKPNSLRRSGPRDRAKIPALLEHGGSTRLGKRKTQRPFDGDYPLHIVFRSTRARGSWSFLRRKNRSKIARIVHETAIESGVEVRHFVNVGNHLHLVVDAWKRKELQRFLRVATCRIVFAVTRTRKGRPIGRFWDQLAYTRNFLIQEMTLLRRYFLKNYFEARGLLKRTKDLALEEKRFKKLLASGAQATCDDTFW